MVRLRSGSLPLAWKGVGVILGKQLNYYTYCYIGFRVSGFRSLGVQGFRGLGFRSLGGSGLRLEGQWGRVQLSADVCSQSCAAKI